MCVCVKNLRNNQWIFFLGAKPAQDENPKQTFLMQKTLKTPCIKKVHDQTQRCQIKNYENNA